MRYCEREITREQYERGKANNGYLVDEDRSAVFTLAEMCGYGVYTPCVACVDGKYICRFYMCTSCD